MKDNHSHFLVSCSKIDFGAIELSIEQQQFCCELSEEIALLCKSLPKSIQTDALLFFIQYFGLSFEQQLFFFKKYYTPSWSVLFWLLQYNQPNSEWRDEDTKNAKRAHCMALLLHLLDDHLNDMELPVTHLTLLIRSQSWLIMINALNKLAKEIMEGQDIAKRFIDDYYSSIRNTKDSPSLNAFCILFRKQMATWLITPLLMTKKLRHEEEFTKAIQSAFGSFGIAWRLLDDIRDIENDMKNGVHSSIYVCLSKEIKNCWDINSFEKSETNINSELIVDYILKNRIVDMIKDRICMELRSAAAIADHYNMTKWAGEFRSLMSPLKDQ
jgi:hypothetical protein